MILKKIKLWLGLIREIEVTVYFVQDQRIYGQVFIFPLVWFEDLKKDLHEIGEAIAGDIVFEARGFPIFDLKVEVKR